MCHFFLFCLHLIGKGILRLICEGEMAYNNKIMLQLRTQLGNCSPKKLYQLILSSREHSEALQEALLQLLRRACQNTDHFEFLLHRVGWFETPFSSCSHILLKVLRIYAARSKQASKVAYNLLIEGLSVQGSHALRALAHLFAESYDKSTILQCLRENYPHKRCPLQMHKKYLEALLYLTVEAPGYRADLLELVMENLVLFDTELVGGDQWVHRPFPEDSSILAVREHQNELAFKLDSLLLQLTEFLESLNGDQKVFGEILLAFQNKVLPIKTTKLLPLVIFRLAESNRARANSFVSFLLGNIFEASTKENSYRIFTQSNFYLFSYVLRSKTLTRKSVGKVLDMMIAKLKKKLQDISIAENCSTDLKQLYLKNETSLLILQSVIVLGLEYYGELEEMPENYRALVKQCSQKLMFEYFLKEELLEKMGVFKKEGKHRITLKYSNKFLPSTLNGLGKLIDPIMRMRLNHLEVLPSQFEGPACRKIIKGETMHSLCSQTVV